jgi:hypothetical protein
MEKLRSSIAEGLACPGTHKFLLTPNITTVSMRNLAIQASRRVTTDGYGRMLQPKRGKTRAFTALGPAVWLRRYAGCDPLSKTIAARRGSSEEVPVNAFPPIVMAPASRPDRVAYRTER